MFDKFGEFDTDPADEARINLRIGNIKDRMLAMMEEHLKTHYPGWSREELIYSKWTMKNS